MIFYKMLHEKMIILTGLKNECVANKAFYLMV